MTLIEGAMPRRWRADKPLSQVDEESPLVESFRGVSTFSRAAFGHWNDDRSRRRAAVEALSLCSVTDTISLRFLWPGEGQWLQAAVGKRVRAGTADDSRSALELIERQLDSWLTLVWPDVGFGSSIVQFPNLPFKLAIHPIAWLPSESMITTPRPNGVNPTEREILVELLDRRQLDIGAALAALTPHAPCELTLELSSKHLNAHECRVIGDTQRRRYARPHDEFEYDERALESFLNDLSRLRRGVLINATARFAVQPASFVLDLVSLALFGSPADHYPSPENAIDLRCTWPAGWLLPRLMPMHTEVLAIAARQSSLRVKPTHQLSGALTLGKTLSGEQIQLSPRDRARHLYLIGGTGTGKSTLIANLIRQDLQSGEGVILIDPHGDLADMTREIVPTERRSELVWSDLSDPSSTIGLNILEGQGGVPALERNYVCNQLISLFKNILYRGVPEAFGPMFETYFRNALMLLMDSRGPDATLMDFERVFHDDKFRNELLTRCTDEKVREFWRSVALRVSWDEIKLENVAPYIACKLTQFTGNPLVRRMIEARQSTLDFRQIMDQGGIALIKIAKGLLGEYDTTLLTTLITIRIAQAGMARAALPPEMRRPVRVYIDEFQNSVGESLADMLAESRKYGLSMTLANQSLSQVDGRGSHSNAGLAALANAANILALRVGPPDAAKLAPWFAPEVSWQDLCRLPDFQAAARVLDNGRPEPASIIRLPCP